MTINDIPRLDVSPGRRWRRLFNASEIILSGPCNGFMYHYWLSSWEFPVFVGTHWVLWSHAPFTNFEWE